MEVLVSLLNFGLPGAFLGAAYGFWDKSRRVSILLLCVGIPVSLVCLYFTFAFATGRWPLQHEVRLSPDPELEWSGSMKNGKPVTVEAKLIRQDQTLDSVARKPSDVRDRPLYLSDDSNSSGRTVVFSGSESKDDGFVQGFVSTRDLERWSIGHVGATGEIPEMANSDEDCKGVHDGYRGGQFAGWRICVDDWFHGEGDVAGAVLSVMKDGRFVGRRKLGLNRADEVAVRHSGDEIFVRSLSLDLRREGDEKATFLLFRKNWRGSTSEAAIAAMPSRSTN